MRKFYLAAAIMGAVTFGASAQTVLLNEGFETASTDTYSPVFPDGWTTIDSYLGSKDAYRWNVYYTERGTISGMHCASCDASMFESDSEKGFGPREEILLSPELTLDNTYQLSFNWKAASASALEHKEYDCQVRVVVDNDIDGAETIFSFQDANILKDSGVLTFPWTGWQIYNSALDLSRWQGKTVKIAFVYKMLKKCANVLYIDDVIVKQFTPPTAPKAELDKRLYNFGDVYMGSKVYSEVISLKNTGTNGLTISDIILPEGVTTTIDKDEVNLDKGETLNFYVAYQASMTSATDDNVVIKTNGGDVTLRVVANKLMLPADASFVGFEGGKIPAGWTSDGWDIVSYALEGDYSVYAGPRIGSASTLISPRLDLSEGAQSVTFTAFEDFDSDLEGGYPENDIYLELSKDGGNNWTVVWTSSETNAIVNPVVDLGTPASDNCYLRWTFSEVAFDSENIPETSFFFLDAIILPKVYGQGGLPSKVSLLTPADGTKDVYNRNVTLTWEEAQFAEGYKLYVGTDIAATNIVNGEDLGNVNSYTIPQLDYNTTYMWRVVAYNSVGDAEAASTWSFTTMSDQTVKSFPYVQDFEGATFPPLGWNTTKDGYTRWSSNEVNAFEGKKSVSADCYGAETSTVLETAEFQLPDTPLEISFYWGNDMPVALEKDESGIVKNPSTVDDGIDACFFEIFDNGEWKQLGILSDKNNKVWYHQVANLSEYAGKTVSFRWRYVGHSYMQSTGVGLDLVKIAPLESHKVSFNVAEWNAGSVNYQSSVTSKKPISLINEGSDAMKIESVTFGTSNFTTTLSAGTIIDAKKGVPLTITFHALNTAAAVDDVMTVTFEGGHTISLPVKGNALASDIRYYNFESDAPGTKQPTDFTTIDVDRKATTAMTGMNYPCYSEAFAFSVQQNEDWNNVFNPVSGDQVLVAIAPANDGDANDWIVSQKMTATANSSFRFYGRNWNSIYSVLPENPHCVEVLVSTESATDTSTFTTVMEKVTMEYYDPAKGYHEFNVDLSAYAGQDIYVAVRHTVTAGLVAFFDDFYFNHFSNFGGVSDITADKGVKIYPNPVADTLHFGAEANVEIFNLAGSKVKEAEGVNSLNVADLAAGVYVVKATTEAGIKTARIVKK